MKVAAKDLVRGMRLDDGGLVTSKPIKSGWAPGFVAFSVAWEHGIGICKQHGDRIYEVSVSPSGSAEA